MALTSDQITAQNFKDFYGQIRPYLNGTAHGGFTPIGTVISLMGKTAPTNYLVCDGTVYNIADYPELAAYFAGQFNSSNFFGGDGITTFAVPDLRGEFLRGTGTNGHADQGNGAAVGIHQDSTEVSNIFYDTANNLVAPKITQSTYEWYITKNADAGKAAVTTFKYNTSSGNETSVAGSAYNLVRPTNTSVLYCIATKNIFMDAGCNYSTDEQVIGTWIDSKPIYQKTFVFESSDLPQVITDNTSVASQYPIGEIVNEVIDIQVECLMADGQTYTGTNGFIGGNNSDTRFYRVLGYNHSHPSTSNCIYIQSWKTAFNTAKAIITIKYTKTTD